MNKRRQIFLIIFFLFFIHSVSRSQTFSYKNYSTLDGLNSALVYNCIQDSKGYMWFCTDAGVARFDGKRFEQFTRSDGLSDNEVFGMYEDSKKRIWFLTFNGHLSFYLDGKFFNEENTPWLGRIFLGESFTSAFEDRKGRIFFGSFGTKFIVLDGYNIKSYEIRGAYGSFNFFEYANGDIYISSSSERFVLKDDVLRKMPLQHKKRDVRYIQSKLGNEFYFSDEGLIRIKNGIEKLILPADLLPSWSSITGCRENADSSFLISTRGNGALLFPYSASYTGSKPIRMLPDKIILSSYIDSENNTWLNTEGDGLYIFQAAYKNLKSFTAQNALINPNIHRVIVDSSGTAWLACSGSMIAEIKNDSVYNYHMNLLVNSKKDRILDITFDNKNILWAATDNGIVKCTHGFPGRLVPLLNVNTWEHPSTKAISADLSGNVFITYFLGVARLVHESIGQKEYFKSLAGFEFKERTFTHFHDHAGRLWVATIRGLNLWEEGKIICFGDSDKILKSRIVQINEINNMLVLSTDQSGIIFFRDGKVIRHLTQADGLPSDICRKAFIRSNRILLGTNLGLASIQCSGDSIKEISVFDISDGLVSNDVHDVYDDGRHIYVATDKGLSIINRFSDGQVTAPPPVYITKVNVGNQPATADSDLQKLTYIQNSLAVNFVAITFQNPDKINYQYKLSNKNNWVSTRNNSIEFSSLTPGHYTFSLRAKKINSGWSKPVSFSFIIHPPFWQTMWFVILLTVTLFMILIYLQRIYSRRKLRVQLAQIGRRELLLNERSRISTDMHDDLGSDLTRIVVLSEVIQVTEKLNHNTSVNLNKISKYASELRKKMDEIIWALNPQHDSLVALISYIHEYTLEYFDENFKACKITLPESIPEAQVSAAFRRNIFLIVKEAFHNIVKHAQASEMNMEIKIVGSELFILIKDNGVGFEEEKFSAAGNGIKNIRKRALGIGGEIIVTSSLGKGCSIQMNCIFAS